MGRGRRGGGVESGFGYGFEGEREDVDGFEEVPGESTDGKVPCLLFLSSCVALEVEEVGLEVA